MLLPALLAQAQSPALSHDSTVTVALMVVVIGALVAVSVAWGINAAKVARLEDDMRESKSDRFRLREDASKDREQVVTVRTTLGHIVAMLEDVRQAVSEGRKAG